MNEWIPGSLPVSRRGDEVQAALHSVVWHLPSVDPGLGVEVILKLTVDVIDDRLPAEDKTAGTLMSGRPNCGGTRINQ